MSTFDGFVYGMSSEDKTVEPPDPATRPKCFGTQPKPDTVLWDERKCDNCIYLESCCRVTFGVTTAKWLTGRRQHTPIEGMEGAFVGPPMKLEFGTKFDKDKLRWSLLPSGTIAQVIQVLEYGAKKYSVGNWIDVPDAKTRYYDAAMRHIDAWHSGENNDSESGLPHLAHAACCILFLLWFDGKSVS